MPSQTQPATPVTPLTPNTKKAPSTAKISPAKGGKKVVKIGKSPQKGAKRGASMKAQKPGKGRTARWGLLMKAGLKPPKTSYSLWANDNRQRIQQELGTSNLVEVAKATGVQWHALSEEDKAPYRARQQELSEKFTQARKAYNEYSEKRSNIKDARVVTKRTLKKGSQKTQEKERSLLTARQTQRAVALALANIDDMQPAPILAPMQLSAALAPTQPEAGTTRRRRAFKMPDDATTMASTDLDATQVADPVAAAAAWE
jgi:hypothetical protein